jgi:hypothetical protein
MKSSDDQFDWDKWVLTRWPRQTKTMPVDSINGYGSEIPIRPASVRSAAPASPVITPDSPDTTTAFKPAQNQTASLRPDKIARASELLADANYPSDKVLNQLAGFLAGKL